MKRRLQNEEELRSLCGGHKDGAYSQNSDEHIVVVGPDQTCASMYPSDSFLGRWPSVKVFCTDTIEEGTAKPSHVWRPWVLPVILQHTEQLSP